MNNYSLITSLGFCVLSYVAAGYVFKHLLQFDSLDMASCFFVGAGLTASTTLFISMLRPELLRNTSFFFMTLSIIAAFFLIVPRLAIRDLHSEFREQTTSYLILFSMALPIFIGTVNLRLWGDEFNMEGPMVRYWLKNSNFFINMQARFSFYNYPRLWVIMLYQSLCFGGKMHEAAGRWLSIVIVLVGAIFIWKKYYRTLKFDKWMSLACSSLWMVFVFGPMFAWSASWYYSIIISILIMISFYYIVTAWEGESLDLKLVTVVAILMAMIVSIRPDGLTYLPLAILLLFATSPSCFRGALRRNMVAVFIILLPSAFIYFSWYQYRDINNLYVLVPYNASPLVVVSRLQLLVEKFWPVTLEMFRMVITEWNLTGVLFVCLIICFVLATKLYKYLNSIEKRMLLLLTLPVYKFIYMIFVNCMYLNQVRLGRHIMQTAPIVYFMLGFLVLKLVEIKWWSTIRNWSAKVHLIALVIVLGVAFCLQLTIGSLFAHLPSAMNDYMEHWAKVIQEEYPQYKRVQLIYSRNAPPSTRIHPTWIFYSTAVQDIPSTLSPLITNISKDKEITDKWEYLEVLHDEAVNAVLVYGAGDEIRNIMGRDFSDNKSYLLEVRKKSFKIVQSEEIPYSDIWVVPWRKKAIKSFLSDINIFF